MNKSETAARDAVVAALHANPTFRALSAEVTRLHEGWQTDRSLGQQLADAHMARKRWFNERLAERGLEPKRH